MQFIYPVRVKCGCEDSVYITLDSAITSNQSRINSEMLIPLLFFFFYTTFTVRVAKQILILNNKSLLFLKLQPVIWLSQAYTCITTRFAKSLVNVEQVPTFEPIVAYDVHRLNAPLCSPTDSIPSCFFLLRFVLKGLLCVHCQLMEYGMEAEGKVQV